jgi:hypothetical protein
VATHRPDELTLVIENMSEAACGLMLSDMGIESFTVTDLDDLSAIDEFLELIADQGRTQQLIHVIDAIELVQQLIRFTKAGAIIV